MENSAVLLASYAVKLAKALSHLDYSYTRVKKLPNDPDQLDDAGLEVWESFAARFARVADLFLGKYVRAAVLHNDPGFDGSLRDFVNQGEKLGLLDDADAWMAIRTLRNITAHEYSEDQLKSFFQALLAETPRLLALSHSTSVKSP